MNKKIECKKDTYLINLIYEQIDMKTWIKASSVRDSNGRNMNLR